MKVITRAICTHRLLMDKEHAELENAIFSEGGRGDCPVFECEIHHISLFFFFFFFFF